MRKKQIAPFGVRMDSELKRKIEESASFNSRSMNAEIIHQLRKIYFPERFGGEKAA